MGVSLGSRVVGPTCLGFGGRCLNVLQSIVPVSKGVEFPGANGRADESQRWVANGCGHASDLTIFPFANAYLEPLAGDVGSLSNGRGSRPQAARLVDCLGFGRTC